ncbi:hypothetical protein KOR42_11210 [Thalassoglobus neptunius]|uniref:Uncharacterized protein n=1 Tax=Thalassoglobus neptunius TaxID=1938619 RepID=A0A5C5X6I9_9PLAN|nr:hypothetical protein [Thalassoglobus neptunius]TWT57755.1 hypothetical protein KOR42_11210 [Thalassoglobus neptunius]
MTDAFRLTVKERVVNASFVREFRRGEIGWLQAISQQSLVLRYWIGSIDSI